MKIRSYMKLFISKLERQITQDTTIPFYQKGIDNPTLRKTDRCSQKDIMQSKSGIKLLEH